MKIIDLLNKIANGEKIPERIKFRGQILDYDSDIDYKDHLDIYLFNSKCCINEKELNEEVEIIEEKKIPEKLNLKLDDWTTPTQCDIELSKKIDEIIDYTQIDLNCLRT